MGPKTKPTQTKNTKKKKHKRKKTSHVDLPCSCVTPADTFKRKVFVDWRQNRRGDHTPTLTNIGRQDKKTALVRVRMYV